MMASLLAVGALVAIAQARAIVTNLCTHPVFLWSVPNNGTALDANNLQLNTGGRYEERWHYGSSENPGISLKISTQPGGVYTGMDELDFAYSIDPKNEAQVWVDLSTLRSHGFNETAFHYGEGLTTSSTELSPISCSVNDEVELVLCGSARTTSVKDDAGLDAISQCYDYLRVPHSTSTESSADAHSRTTSAHSETQEGTTTTMLMAHTVTQGAHQAKVTVHLPPKHTAKFTDQASLSHTLQRASHQGPKASFVDNFCMPKVTYLEAWNLWQGSSRAIQPGNATMADKIKVCILPYCEPIVPFVDCSDLEDKLEETTPYDWTSDEDVC
jgi:hypothetical protein